MSDTRKKSIAKLRELADLLENDQRAAFIMSWIVPKGEMNVGEFITYSGNISQNDYFHLLKTTLEKMMGVIDDIGKA